MKMKLVLATGNMGKVAEMTRLLEPFDIEVLSVKDFDSVPDVEEDGDTFFENSRKKALEISTVLGLPALADDSGLEVDALGGRPGVLSARYSGEDATDLKNNIKLLDEMKGVAEKDRTARFRCVMVAADPSGRIISADGSCEGVITEEMQGDGGFGYDPVFYLPELGRTMAQLSRDEKNGISHRGRAIAKIVKELPSFLSEVE